MYSCYVYIIAVKRQKSQEEVGHHFCTSQDRKQQRYVEEPKTENDETDARSVASEEEDNEEEDTKAEAKTTKKAHKVNIKARLFLNF